MGLNTIREIVNKNSSILDSETLNYLASFSANKNKNVNSAAKGLINFYRDVDVMKLEKKYRG